MCRARRLILDGVRPEAILTMSFNRAAARDMEARYRSLFGDQGPLPRFQTTIRCAMPAEGPVEPEVGEALRF